MVEKPVDLHQMVLMGVEKCNKSEDFDPALSRPHEPPVEWSTLPAVPP
jgi:hypothetical protein